VNRFGLWLTILAVAALVCANGVNAIFKGGDFSVYLEAGQRFIDGTPLYSDSGVGAGVIGPPFQAAAFVPFAILERANVITARLAWYGLNLLLLACGVVWWVAALAPALGVALNGRGLPLEPARLVLPLLAILFPLQTNFEHQNLNVVLLAVTGASARALTCGRDRLSGALTGLAVAVKAFPLLLVLIFFWHRLYRATLIAIGTSVLLTTAAMARYGASGIDVIRDWLALSAAGGWPIRGNNQSLFAMLARYFGPEGLSARGHLPRDPHPVIYFGWLLAAAALIAAISWKSWRWRFAPLTSFGLAASLIVAILVAPIAWDHYWTLLFPAFFVVWNAKDPAWLRRAFYAAAVLTSGFSRLTVGVAGLTLARQVSTMTWAGLLVLVALFVAGDHIVRGREEPAGSQPAPR
jgi:alpha-1,2-mannosyltransferase